MSDDNYSLIPDAQMEHVLLLETAEGWTLPRHSASVAAAINQAMEEQLGLKTRVLYRAYDRYKDSERDDQQYIYALENCDPTWVPSANGRWVGRGELAQLQLREEEHRAVVESWFAEREERVGLVERPVWAREGWFVEAMMWVRSQVEAQGYRLIEEAIQVKVDLWATVVRVPTAAEALYFKAVAPIFAYEVPLDAVLARLVPDFVPGVLATETERHWVLMQDVGSTLRWFAEDNLKPELWGPALACFAEMQIELAAHQEELLESGCPDYRLQRLPGLLEEVLEDRAVVLVGQERGLPEAEYAQLQALGSQLRAQCEKLASYGIPESLHHDDFHDGNIALRDGKTRFFDWGESAVAHPFCSLMIAERVAFYIYDYDEASLASLRDAYLEPWTRYRPLEELREAYGIGVWLGKLCRALTWYRLYSTLGPEGRVGLEDVVPYWLRVFLGTTE